MADHNDLGKLGEDLALKTLLTKGYKLKTRNYRFGKGEIDLIMEDTDTLVFIEVKTRQTSEIGEPFQAVTKRKQKLLIKTAEHYILSTESDLNARFDIVSIVHNQYRTEISHIDNAFYPS